jgi:hypothetical protein
VGYQPPGAYLDVPGLQEVEQRALVERGSILVSPTAVSLDAGASYQFSAEVVGLANHAVTWSATGGTISSTGLFTAGSTSGSYTVTATSVANPSTRGQAAGTIVQPTSSGFRPGSFSGTVRLVGFAFTAPASAIVERLLDGRYRVTLDMDGDATNRFNVLEGTASGNTFQGTGVEHEACGLRGCFTNDASGTLTATLDGTHFLGTHKTLFPVTAGDGTVTYSEHVYIFDLNR